MPLGGGRATPAPLLSLDSGRVLQPRCLLSSLTQKCFISLPDPRGEGQSCVKLRFFAAVWVGLGRRSKCRAGSVATRSLKHRSQAWVLVSTHPPTPQIRRTPLCLTCCGLRHVLFLTPSWNWLSSSKDRVLFLFLPLSHAHPSSL